MTSPSALAAVELRLHRRHGILAGVAVTTALWAAVLLALPAGLRLPALRWILLLEVTAIGFFFLPALAVMERSNGVTAALQLTRLAPSAALAVRCAVLTAGALAGSAVLITAAGAGWPAAVIAGVVLSSVLFSLVAVLVIGRSENLTSFVARTPLIATPLMVPALLDGTGLVDSPLLALSPVTGALRLLGGEASLLPTAILAIWLGALWAAALHIGFDVRPHSRGAGSRVRAGIPRTGPLRSFASADRRTLAGDPLLVLMLAGIPLIVGGLGWLVGPGAAFIESRFGLDIAAHLPAIWAFVLLLHVPAMIGSLAGLLFLEDRDAGLLPALAVTPATVRSLFVYRMGLTVLVAAATAVLGSLALGIRHPGGLAGLLAAGSAAGAVASVPAVLMAALPGDRIQGMALMKAMALPLYLPLSWWFAAHPAGWLFLALPTGWTVRSAWAPTAPEAWLFAAGGVLIASGLAAALRRRITG